MDRHGTGMWRHAGRAALGLALNLLHAPRPAGASLLGATIRAFHAPLITAAARGAQLCPEAAALLALAVLALVFAPRAAARSPFSFCTT